MATDVEPESPPFAEAPLLDEEPAGVPARRELFEGRALTPIAAFLAWAITLLPTALGRGATFLPQVLAFAALAAGLSGPIVFARRPRLARYVGVSLFLALATATWLSASAAIHPQRLDPIRGVCGAVAWGVFVLSWSERWGKKAEGVAVDGGGLKARAALPPLAAPLAGLGVLLSLAFLFFAWRIVDADRALVGHAVAVACSVGLVSAAATVATARGKRRQAGGRRPARPAFRSLIALFAVLLAGALIVALR